MSQSVVSIKTPVPDLNLAQENPDLYTPDTVDKSVDPETAEGNTVANVSITFNNLRD